MASVTQEPLVTREDLQAQVSYLKNCLDKIIDNVPGSVYWKNEHGVYLGCNQAFLSKANLTDKQDVIGKTDIELWPEYADKLLKRDAEVIQRKDTIEEQEHIQVNTGEDYYFWSAKTPLSDETGKVIGVVGNSLDITAIVHAKKKAEEANNTKTQFLLNMQHDIKTPISHIVGLSEILYNSKGISASAREHIRLINISSKRLMDLITDMLHFADIESGQTPHRSQEFNLNVLIQKIIELNAITIQSKGLQISVDYDANIAKRLIGDSYRLYRVLLNLFANALKFTSEGSIKIIAKQTRMLTNYRVEIELSVEDTGIGIPANKYLAIFERFTRLSAAGSNQYEGSGLGLWIVKKFIEEMGGEVAVTSEVGQGTRFTCVFPCEVAEACIKEMEN